MKEDDKEDKKENNNANINQIELGFLMVDQLLGNEAFVNMTNEIAKNIDVGQLMSNMLNQPELAKLKNSP